MAIPARFTLIYADRSTGNAFTLTADPDSGVTVDGSLTAPEAIDMLAKVTAVLQEPEMAGVL